MTTVWTISSSEEEAIFSTQDATTANVTHYAESSAELPALDKLLLLTDEQRELAENVLQPMKYVFTVLAVPLALCNVIVFSQRDMRSASGIYVTGLNSGQLIYVLSRTVNDIWADSVDQPYSQYYWCLYSMYVSVYVGLLVAKRASYVILCLASIERLYAVLRPLHIKNFVLAKRPLLCVLTVYAVSIVWHAYYLARSQLIMVPVPPTGTPFCVFILTDLYVKHQEVNDAFSLAAKIAMSYASLLLQLVLNFFTVWALRRHNKANKHVTSSANEDSKRQQERQLTLTLLGASATFVVLSLPTLFFNLLSSVYSEFFPGRKYGNLFTVMAGLTYNLAVLGCGVDFFSYFGLSSKFRKTLKHMIGRKFLRSQDSLETRTQIDAVDVSSGYTGN